MYYSNCGQLEGSVVETEKENRREIRWGVWAGCFNSEKQHDSLLSTKYEGKTIREKWGLELNIKATDRIRL